MSFLSCQTTYVKNDDGTSTFTATMDTVTTKCTESFCADPEEWIKNAIVARSRVEGERIYKSEMERHLEAGTMPTNPTKQSLILAYEIPVQETSNTPL
jgi:hypothetical protein